MTVMKLETNSSFSSPLESWQYTSAIEARGSEREAEKEKIDNNSIIKLRCWRIRVEQCINSKFQWSSNKLLYIFK